jgi:hypothetical protein
MNYIDALIDAIKTGYNCKATHKETVPVKEMLQGKVAWEGLVEVFELEGHPQAKKCYGWGFEKEKGEIEFVTVLEISPVNNPKTAVSAYILNKI